MISSDGSIILPRVNNNASLAPPVTITSELFILISSLE